MRLNESELKWFCCSTIVRAAKSFGFTFVSTSRERNGITAESHLVHHSVRVILQQRHMNEDENSCRLCIVISSNKRICSVASPRNICFILIRWKTKSSCSIFSLLGSFKFVFIGRRSLALDLTYANTMILLLPPPPPPHANVVGRTDVDWINKFFYHG